MQKSKKKKNFIQNVKTDFPNTKFVIQTKYCDTIYKTWFLLASWLTLATKTEFALQVVLINATPIEALFVYQFLVIAPFRWLLFLTILKKIPCDKSTEKVWTQEDGSSKMEILKIFTIFGKLPSSNS